MIYHLVLSSRKSRLHVGPRYKARGLNELADPGNEFECEQVCGATNACVYLAGPLDSESTLTALHLSIPKVVWRLQASADMRTAPILWSRYTWRRGSVPLWWGVKIKNNGMGEAEIKIQQSNTFRGSRRSGAKED